MRVLMISTDSKILERSSDVQERMKEYGSLVDALDIIVCSKNGEQVELLGNVRIFSTKSSSKIFYLKDAVKIAKKHALGQIDLVTAQDPFETGLAGWLISRRLKAKLQLQVHTDFLSEHFVHGSLKNRIRVMLAKFLLPKAHSIRVVSERIKNSLTTYGLRLTSVSVLPIFVDVAKIQSESVTVDLYRKYPQFDFIILMTSRLEKEKNIKLAIHAMQEVVKKFPKTGLVIAGSGSEEKNLRLRTYDLGLQDNVKFEGWVEDLASYYKTCDAYLLCSNYEGYGMTLIMAAASGCGIITTHVGLVGEVINKDNALVVEVGDKQAIIGAIMKLQIDDALRKELGQRARASAEYLGSKEEYLEKYKQSWEQV